MLKDIQKNLNIDSLKDVILNIRKQVSANYICLEFGFDYLQIAEIFYSNGKVNFKNLIRKDIPKESIDKGIPNDPEKMGLFISEILSEEKIFINKAAIVLSPDAVFTRLIEIPDHIKDDKIDEYLMDPTSLIQIPISIIQTEFNIYKTSYQLNKTKNCNTFLFVAAPKQSIDNLQSTCKIAGLDLVYVEVAFNSLMRLINFEYLIEPNLKNQFLIFLELNDNCTNFTLLDEFGPIYTNRLSSIKEFPKKIMNKDIVLNEAYLPISKLDLKVLANEVKRVTNNFFTDKDLDYNFKIILYGGNSSHPNICKLLSELLKSKTYLISPNGNSCIGEIKYAKEIFYDSNFERIFGLGHGLLNKQDCISSTNNSLEFIEENKPNNISSLVKKTLNIKTENVSKKNNAKNSPNDSKVKVSDKDIDNKSEMDNNRETKFKFNTDFLDDI